MYLCSALSHFTCNIVSISRYQFYIQLGHSDKYMGGTTCGISPNQILGFLLSGNVTAYSAGDEFNKSCTFRIAANPVSTARKFNKLVFSDM